MADPLEIKIRMDNSHAKTAAAEVAGANKAVEAAALKAANAVEGGWNKGAAAATKAAGAVRDAQGRFVKAGTDADAAGTQAAAAFTKMGTAAQGGFFQAQLGAQLATKALSLAIDAARDFGRAVEIAAGKQVAMAKNFGDMRGKLADLATVEGKKLDNAFTLDFAKFQARTGLNQAEALKLRSSLANAAMQHVGTRISAPEFEQVKEQGGRWSAARGLDQQTAGDLLGRIIGTEDFQKKYGEQASEMAVGKANEVAAILGRGQGENATMLAQTAEVLGVYANPTKAAALTSVMAEREPGQAGTYARASIRALSDFQDKRAVPILKEAGIKPGMDPLEAAGRLDPIIRKKMQAQKLTESKDVLGQYFGDTRQVEGLATLLDKGVKEGALADRLAEGAKFAGAKPAADMVAEFFKGDEGGERLDRENLAFQTAKRGMQGAPLERLRTQAMARLANPDQPGGPRLDTTAAEFADLAAGKISFGMLKPGSRDLIDEEAARLQDERAKAPLERPRSWVAKALRGASALPAVGPLFGAAAAAGVGAEALPVTEEDRRALLNRRAEQLRGQGVDPLGGAAPGADDQATRENTKATATLTAAVESLAGKLGLGGAAPVVAAAGRPPGAVGYARA